jgi:hypothetical protein
MEQLKLDKLAYPISEWARITSRSRSHLYEEIRAGRLRLTKSGNKSLIMVEDGLAHLRGEAAQ